MAIVSKTIPCTGSFTWDYIAKTATGANTAQATAEISYTQGTTGGDTGREKYAFFSFAAQTDSFWDGTPITKVELKMALLSRQSYDSRHYYRLRRSALALNTASPSYQLDVACKNGPFNTNWPQIPALGSYTTMPLSIAEAREMCGKSQSFAVLPAGIQYGGLCQCTLAGYAHASLAPHIVVYYEDGTNTPPVVQAESPNEMVVDASAPIVLRWRFSHPFSLPQSHYEIQADTGAGWERLAPSTPSAQKTYTVRAGYFASGTVRWRIRCYVLGRVPSAWNEASFMALAAPAPPVIRSVSNSAKPTVQWQAAEQAGYELELDGGTPITLYGNVRSHTFAEYLADGEHTLRLRVYSEAALYSSWATQMFGVKNAPPAAIRLTAHPTPHAQAELQWWPGTTFTAYTVLRDGVAIARVSSTQYTDADAVGTESYTVRGEVGVNYALSPTVRCTVPVPDALLRAANGTDGAPRWIELRGRAEHPPQHLHEIRPRLAWRYYAGLRYPTPHTAGEMDEVHTLRFTLPKRAGNDYTQLKALCGQQVVYKDCAGERFWGTLERLRTNTVDGFDFEAVVRVGENLP